MAETESVVTEGGADAGDAGETAEAVPENARRALPRVVLTADAPVGKAGPEISAGRALADAGNYVLLAAPAEAAEVSTTAAVSDTGVLRVLNVPVDADAAAEISVARSNVAALAGSGLVTGLRRKLARRKLAAVRDRVWQAAAADARWGERCEAAFRPYAEAFAPVAQAPVGQAATVDAKGAVPEGVVLGVGPTNMAGQGYEWARAVERRLPGVRAETFTLSSGNTFGFAADRTISTDDWLSRTWQLGQLAYVLDNYSHVLAECAMPPFGRLNGPWANFDLAELAAAGVAVGLAFHGSEIRDPAAQRARVPFSPFDPDHELTRALQSKVDRLGPVVRAMDVPKFVSTPDLLHDVPDAAWLPVVVDPQVWATDKKPLRRERPVVVHAPSSPFTKGTGLIEPVVEEMHDAGLIEYRRIKGVRASEMPALLADADIVLDQFVFGSYGVMSVQAMAAGRVTVCYLHESVTEHLPDDVPMVNADPDTLGSELERILAERDEAGKLAARGPAYVRDNHDGTRSARVLAEFLGVTP
ncbi:glycosyltransferase [Streptodolium elevatio]|uniref:Glycosyltransferase n=1 Tax=Streptodolium elevatio TaxID=3157996 RepID=A0ABV3DFN4_9ACTN